MKLCNQYFLWSRSNESNTERNAIVHCCILSVTGSNYSASTPLRPKQIFIRLLNSFRNHFSFPLFRSCHLYPLTFAASPSLCTLSLSFRKRRMVVSPSASGTTIEDTVNNTDPEKAEQLVKRIYLSDEEWNSSLSNPRNWPSSKKWKVSPASLLLPLLRFVILPTDFKLNPLQPAMETEETELRILRGLETTELIAFVDRTL